MTYLPTYHKLFFLIIFLKINYLNMGKFNQSNGPLVTSQNDQLNGPYFANKKNHPNHNGHIKIELSKMMEWSFLRMSKLGCFYYIY
jgi:hypothetical protein